MKAAPRKVAIDKGNINSYVDGLRRDSFDSYASIRHNADQSMAAISRRLEGMFNCEAI